MVIGTEGAGMFNHIDVLRTSSWQAQLSGAKTWHLCAPDQRPFLYGPGRVDCFHPDYARYPLFRYARCWEDTVRAGEMVLYPLDFWHQTRNLATPSIAISGSVLDANSRAAIAAELEAECAFGKFKWRFSPELCAALRERCFPLWKTMFP